MWMLGIGNMEQTKKLHGVVEWLLVGGGRAAVRKAWGCRNGGGLASNGVQIELRAPLRFCMVKSELHFNFDWAPFGIGKWDSTWFSFFAMKTSLHDLILFLWWCSHFDPIGKRIRPIKIAVLVVTSYTYSNFYTDPAWDGGTTSPISRHFLSLSVTEMELTQWISSFLNTHKFQQR